MVQCPSRPIVRLPQSTVSPSGPVSCSAMLNAKGVLVRSACSRYAARREQPQNVRPPVCNAHPTQVHRPVELAGDNDLPEGWSTQSWRSGSCHRPPSARECCEPSGAYFAMNASDRLPPRQVADADHVATRSTATFITRSERTSPIRWLQIVLPYVRFSPRRRPEAERRIRVPDAEETGHRTARWR
jgi:hypothetical protein